VKRKSVKGEQITKKSGHPLFSTLAKLAIEISQIGNAAWRVGVLCAIFGALAAHYVFKTVKLYPYSMSRYQLFILR
jgi:Protein of unknown function (DUF2723)